jgi:hypothetical protein
MLDSALLPEEDCLVLEESDPYLSDDNDNVNTLSAGYTWIIHMSRSFILHA